MRAGTQQLIAIIFLMVSTSSCQDSLRWSVLSHYKRGSQERAAAEYLLDNMPGHYSYSGEQIDYYKGRMDSLLRIPQMRDSAVRYSKFFQAESEARFPAGVYRIPDEKTVTAKFLIENIDGAFSAWRSAPWHDEIDFTTFCRYILPYRVGTEQLVPHWRDSLKAEYSKYLEGITDLNEAYSTIMAAVEGKMRSNDQTQYPYSLDVLTIRDIRFAICSQRCVVYTDVLRSLGIPAAVDNTPRWANYSRSGHSWVVLPVDGVKQNVDAAFFKPDGYPNRKDFPYHLDSAKVAYKVMRQSFDRNDLEDVSSEYGFTDSVIVNAPDITESLYLCTFRTGDDWETAVKGDKLEEGSWLFRNLGAPVLFLPTSMRDGARKTAGNPFILSKGGSVMEIVADGSLKENIRLLRKYPLMTYWTNRWLQMKGGVFQASNDPDFKDFIVLDSIADIPVHHNVKRLSQRQRYQYVRFVYPEGAKLMVERFSVYDGSEKLDGVVIGNNFSYDPVSYATNHNMEYTSPPKGILWTGFDFGHRVAFDSFSYDFKNDDNFISEGDTYELFMWDGRWVSLGRQTATCRHLDYTDVPKGALLLLKDLTKGKEERPFVYRDGKQVFM